jgi:hypothetical protein
MWARTRLRGHYHGVPCNVVAQGEAQEVAAMQVMQVL